MRARQHRIAAAVAATALLALAACSSDDGPSVSAPSTQTDASSSAAGSSSSSSPTSASSSSSTTSSSSSSSSSSTTAAARTDLKVGECLGPRPNYAALPCSSGHTYEVYAVKNDNTDSGDLVKRSARQIAVCNTEAAGFLGNPGFGVTRLAGEPLPASVNGKSDEQIVCVAKEFRTSLSGLASPTSSLKGKLKGDGFYKYNLCVKEKASADEISFVSCDKPHASESVGGRLNGKAGDPFPGGDKVQSEALKFCQPIGRKFLGAPRGDIVASQNSGGAAPWGRGQMITGCFVEVKDGTVTKSLRGIKDKPLSEYR